MIMLYPTLTLMNNLKFLLQLDKSRARTFSNNKSKQLTIYFIAITGSFKCTFYELKGVKGKDRKKKKLRN